MNSLQLQKLRISVKAYESGILDSSCNQIIDAVKASGKEAIGPIPLPTKKLKVPVRKSPDGEGSETWDRWEARLHKRLIYIDADERAMRQLMRIQIPDGVKISIQIQT